MRYFRILLRITVQVPTPFVQSDLLDALKHLSSRQLITLACTSILNCQRGCAVDNSNQSSQNKKKGDISQKNCPLNKLYTRENFIFVDPFFLMTVPLNLLGEDHPSQNLQHVGCFLTLFDPSLDLAPLLPIIIPEMLKLIILNHNYNILKAEYRNVPFYSLHSSNKTAYLGWKNVVNINISDILNIDFTSFMHLENITASSQVQQYELVLKGVGKSSKISQSKLWERFSSQATSFGISLPDIPQYWSEYHPSELFFYPQNNIWVIKFYLVCPSSFAIFFKLLEIIRITPEPHASVPFFSIFSIERNQNSRK